MKNFLTSFYGKLSAVLLILLLVLGVAQLAITYNSSMKLISAADQQINLDLAKNIATRLDSVLMRQAPEEEVESAIHYLMVYNPRIEIYVLDANGKIINFFADPDVVEADRVPLKPIQIFLQNAPNQLIEGMDPRNPETQKPFSAAEVSLSGGRTGYVYIILSGERYNSALEMVRDSYIIGTSLKVLLIILLLTAIAGLVLFGLLTRRLRTMTGKVEAFEKGDYSIRLNEQSADEVGQLAGSFNHMAETIQASVKELQKTDELRRNLIANISHDLRSPLSSMQGYLETILIKEENISEDERQQYLGIILRNTELLRTMVDELFELSRLDTREALPQKEPFAIADLVQDVMLKLKPRADENQIALATDIKQPVPQVWADIAMIERVLTNLLENAISHTDVDGDIEVSLDVHAGSVAITVKDTGTGIGQEDLRHIFDRFYRADKSRSLASGNTGLGLAIAKKILELHDSEIQVDSTEGKGTAFSFELQVYNSKN